MKRNLTKVLEPKRLLEYFISGGAYFWVGYVTFYICDSIFGLSLWWAKLLANIVGWVVNYLLQRYWVFGDGRKGNDTQVTFRYAVITLVDFVLDYFIVAGLQAIGISPYIGQFISAGFFTVWNYAWYKWWVFPAKYVHRSRTKKRRPPAHHTRRRLA